MELYRAVVEVRHLAVRYLDTRGQIIEKFKEKYPELGLEPGLRGDLDAHTRLKDRNRGVVAFTNGLHTGLEMTFEPFDLGIFAADAEKFCRAVARDIFRVNDVSRMGMRFFHRWKIPDRDLVDFTLRKVLCSTGDFSDLDIMTANWGFRFEAKDSEYGYNLQFYLEPAKEDGKRFTGYLVADYDAYQNDLPISAVASLRNSIQEAHQKALSMGNRFLEGIIQL